MSAISTRDVISSCPGFKVCTDRLGGTYTTRSALACAASSLPSHHSKQSLSTDTSIILRGEKIIVLLRPLQIDHLGFDERSRQRIVYFFHNKHNTKRSREGFDMMKSTPSLLLSLVTMMIAVVSTVMAQEVPTLPAEMHSYNVTYRQNVCGRHDEFYNGNVELRNALQGFQLHPYIRVGEYFNINPTTGGIDEEDPGLVAVILDELSERAGFTWRNSYGDNYGPAANKTWTELVAWAVEVFDVSVDWWNHTPERLKMGIGFPEGFVDASYIMVGIKQDEDGDSSSSDGSFAEKYDFLWAWTQPFSTTVWLFICITIIVSAILYTMFESVAYPITSAPALNDTSLTPVIGGNNKNKRSKIANQWGPSLYGTILICLQHFQLRPRTRAGRIIGVSVAFWSLIMTATYTANLASFFVIQHTPVNTIQDIQDAIDNGLSMCVYGDTASHDYVAKHYPKGTYIPKPGPWGHVESLLDGECNLAILSMNEWVQVKINKEFNGECNLEWVGRIINFLEAGFALKSDSGRLCTSLIQDVLNVHLNDMKSDGTMDLIQTKFLSKSQDVACDAIEAAEKSAGDEFGVLSLKEMAGPFVNHAAATVLAILVATFSSFTNRRRRRNGNDDDDDKDNDDTFGNGTMFKSTSRMSSEPLPPANLPMRGEEDDTEDMTMSYNDDGSTSGGGSLRQVLSAQNQKQASLEMNQNELSKKMDFIVSRQDETIAQLSELLKTMKKTKN